MKREKSEKARLDHEEVRRIHRERRKELGDMAPYVSNGYYVMYCAERTKYKEATVQKILFKKD